MLQEDPGGEETEGFATRAANELLTILCSALQAVTKGYTEKKKKNDEYEEKKTREEAEMKAVQKVPE